MVYQTTIGKSVSVNGYSLHHGGPVNLTLHPAPPYHRYKFLRSDLPGKPVIDASCRFVERVNRATTLASGNVHVQTVEHILSALYGLGVDNVLIELDSVEPPIFDGSATAFVELIDQAKIIEQSVQRSAFFIQNVIHLETANGSIMSIFPDKKFRISCVQIDSRGYLPQYLSLEITPEIYRKEIAPARTFVHYDDVKSLMQDGLIKGGSLENALVIRGESVLSKEALRFHDEFVRHKILDIIGDLALIGLPCYGHFVAIKPGHHCNTALSKAVLKQYEEFMLMAPMPQTANALLPVLNINELKKYLPHRYPFLMVDRIVSFEGDSQAIGVKCVTINEPYFQGHFVNHPVMPGVLQLEAMAQVASILMYRKIGMEGNIGYFMSANGVKFRKPVTPGDTLFIHVELLKTRKTYAKAICYCRVNEEVVSEGTLLFGLLK